MEHGVAASRRLRFAGERLRGRGSPSAQKNGDRCWSPFLKLDVWNALVALSFKVEHGLGLGDDDLEGRHFVVVV